MKLDKVIRLSGEYFLKRKYQVERPYDWSLIGACKHMQGAVVPGAYGMKQNVVCLGQD